MFEYMQQWQNVLAMALPGKGLTKISPLTKCRLAPPWKRLVKNQGWMLWNLQILIIVSAVKMCKKCLQTLQVLGDDLLPSWTPPGDFRPPDPGRYSPRWKFLAPPSCARCNCTAWWTTQILPILKILKLFFRILNCSCIQTIKIRP